MAGKTPENNEHIRKNPDTDQNASPRDNLSENPYLKNLLPGRDFLRRYPPSIDGPEDDHFTTPTPFNFRQTMGRLRLPLPYQNPLPARNRETAEPDPTTEAIPMAAVLKGSPSRYLELSLSSDFRYITAKERSERLKPFARFFADKGFQPRALEILAASGMLDELFSNLVLREDASFLSRPFQSNILFTSRPFTATPEGNQYTGSPEENQAIDRSIAASTSKTDRRRQHAGRGATRRFSLGNLDTERLRIFTRSIPAIVIGAGPAGLMATREMIQMGFSPDNITVIDRTGEYGGIWNQKNVAGGSKNNPFQFVFEHSTLDAAPGPGSTVSDFLQELEVVQGFRRIPRPVKGVVTAVEPGDLRHTVTYRTADGERTISAPIVIDAIGTGKPADPNRPGVMTTDTPEKAGIRWQQIWTEKQAEKLRGQTVILVGLGNSSIEMLEQIQAFNRQGYNIDYRVVTHYPAQAVENPTVDIQQDGKTYRVYRDLSKSILTKIEGDLPEAQAVYEQALRDGKIVSDVTHWHSEDGKFTATTRDGNKQTYDFAQQYTLIGYVHDAEMLQAMGMQVTNEKLGEVAYDYDGEIQRHPGATGRDRVYPGYFGLGAVLKRTDNPNAVVMPGIMHRMYDTLFGIAVRSVEYSERRRQVLSSVFTDFERQINALERIQFDLPPIADQQIFPRSRTIFEEKERLFQKKEKRNDLP